MTDAPEKKLELIRRLLAVAEHPGTGPEEAETYRERAYKLMAKYGIERAHLAAAGQITDELSSFPFVVDKTHQAERILLLVAITSAKQCRVLQWKLNGKTYLMVSGYQSDLEAVQMLYASLSLQMIKEVAHVTPTGRKSLGTARKSFMAGFASRAGEKLRAANKAATVEAAHVEGRSTDLVLRDRQTAVDDYFNRKTPTPEPSRRGRSETRPPSTPAARRATAPTSAAPVSTPAASAPSTLNPNCGRHPAPAAYSTPKGNL